MAESIILWPGNSPGGLQAKHGKSETLYAVPVEPCRGNGRYVQGDGIKDKARKGTVVFSGRVILRKKHYSVFA